MNGIIYNIKFKIISVEEFNMKVRRGAIPTFLGTAVTATGAALTAMEIVPLVAAGAVGFGLAHIVLGGIEMSRNKNNRTKRMN